MDMLNVAAIYKAIGPAGCALVLAACAAVYFALKNYIYLYIVWRDFRRAYPDIEKGGFGGQMPGGMRGLQSSADIATTDFALSFSSTGFTNVRAAQ